MATCSGVFPRYVGGSVLFIDANPELRRTYAELGVSLALDTHVAPDLGAALQETHGAPVDATFVAVAADRPLRELAEKVREGTHCAWLVAVTHDTTADDATYEQAGFDAVLHAPFELSECEVAVVHAGRRARARNVSLAFG